MNDLKGVIWDMDGVIVDSGEFHYQAWRGTLVDYDIPFSRKIFEDTFGMNNEGILKLLKGNRIDPQTVQEISDRKEASYRQAIRGRVKVLPGVLTLLKSIRKADIAQAIGSSAPQENIDAVIGELGLRNFFDAIISAADMPGKPDPAVFLTAAKCMNAAASQVLVIEDAIAGVEAAHRAGMKCVAVTTTNPASSLKKANLVVERLDSLSVDDLVALINEDPEA
jgi:beta-phosphoglucomutase family hydrolase